MPGLWKAIGLCLFLFFLSAAQAYAHLVIKDSALFSGLVNSFIHVPSLLIILACGCRAGQYFKRHPSAQPAHVFLFLGPMLVGILLGRMGFQTASIYGVLMGLVLFNSLLTALDRDLSFIWFGTLSVFCAMALGIYTGADVRLPFDKFLFFISGSILMAGSLIVFIVLLMTNIQNSIFQIGIRVLGSWLTAITAMMLAYEFVR